MRVGDRESACIRIILIMKDNKSILGKFCVEMDFFRFCNFRNIVKVISDFCKIRFCCSFFANILKPACELTAILDGIGQRYKQSFTVFDGLREGGTSAIGLESVLHIIAIFVEGKETICP